MGLVINGVSLTASKIIELSDGNILHAMKNALMEYETIDLEQVDDLMARRTVRPPYNWDNHDSGSATKKKKNKKIDDTDLAGTPAEEH